MHRVSASARSQLRRFVVRSVSVIALCAAATANATTDGLTISGSPPTSAAMGQPYSFTPTVSNPGKRTLHFVIWSKPAWATFNASTGHLAGTPAAANVGTQNVRIIVTDGVDEAYLPAFAITVHPPAADKPVISGSPPKSVTVGQTYSFTPTVSNPAKLALRFVIWSKPAWATFNASTGHLAGTPAAANVGTQNAIRIIVTDGVDEAYLPAFVITVHPPAADKPVISGTPPTSITAGSTYKFQPTAHDPTGKALSFSVQNKPSWASFSIATGLLDGTPTNSQRGTYSNIIISASNGQNSSALPAFGVTVGSKTGSATLNWADPTVNTNGTRLTDLAGIRIYYGTSASNLSQMVQVANATATSITISNLTTGTWYFGGVAYTTGGTASAMSGIVSKYVP